MVGKPREIFLGDDVVIARRRRVETVEDDSDEQVHEYVRDRQREAFVRVERGGGGGGKRAEHIMQRERLLVLLCMAVSLPLAGYDPEKGVMLHYFRLLTMKENIPVQFVGFAAGAFTRRPIAGLACMKHGHLLPTA